MIFVIIMKTKTSKGYDIDSDPPQHLSLQDPHRHGNSSLGDWSVTSTKTFVFGLDF